VGVSVAVLNFRFCRLACFNKPDVYRYWHLEMQLVCEIFYTNLLKQKLFVICPRLR
jgi:hypothetical protein